MIAEAAFYGRAKDQTTGSTVTLNFNLYRVHTVATTSGSINIKLQSARQLQKGGPIGYVINSGSNSFNLVDNSNNLLATMAAGDAVTLALIDNATAAGSWIVIAGTANFVADPPVNLYFYVVGGLPTGTYDQTAREYDTQLDTWTQRSDLPSPTTSFSKGAAAVNGTSGYFFGITASLSTDRKLIFQYDPDTWTAKTASSDEHWECAGASIGGSVIAFNGSPANAYHTNEYNVAGDSWTSRTTRPSPQRITEPTAAAANSKVVLTDGTANAIQTYVVDTWTSKTTRPGADARRPGTTSKSNICYTYGGAASGLFIASVYNYDESIDTWAAMASMSSGREQTSVCSIGSFNYLAGGKKGTAGTSSTSSSTSTKETLEHTVGADTYLTKADMSPVAASPNAAYSAMNQGAAITP